MMDAQDRIYSIALTKIKSLSPLNARELIDKLGSATEVFAHRGDIASVIPDASPHLAEVLANVDDALREAEAEMEFVEKNHLRMLVIGDDDYPCRLVECSDAPLVLYTCGDVDFNRQHVVSIVGTRKCTDYGRGLCKEFVADLKEALPGTLIVSGLAYGIDICAHRASLGHGMDTVAVLAHGLDKIYPSLHRQTAADMVHNGGGLLTEYTSNTRPEKHNFVRRNRIVAGVCDACIVVESSLKGGSLITADMAQSYSRDVFAFPGRTYDEHSSGCNALIRRQRAQLITSAADFMEDMGWAQQQGLSENKRSAVQQEIFLDLSDEEQAVVDTLRDVDDKHINQIVIEANIPYSRVSSILFELEMQTVVQALGGARYRLVRRSF